MSPRTLALLAAVALAACTSKPSPPGAPSPSAPAPSSAALSPARAARPAAAPAASALGAPPAPAAPRCTDAGAGPEPDAAALKRLMAKRQKTLRECYERALKVNPEAKGRVVVRFTIGRCGELGEIAADAARGATADVTACVVAAMRTWKTPFRPAEAVEVEYPFSFAPSR